MGFFDRFRASSASDPNEPLPDGVKPGYLFTADELDALRARHLESVSAWTREVFAHDPSLRSVTLLVAQYWSDEANDAVHPELVWSVLETPVLQVPASWDDWDGLDRANLGDRSQWKIGDGAASPFLPWDDNGACIPLYAAFCVEGAHQEGLGIEFYRPIAILRRAGGSADKPEVTTEFVGEMARPWLDGIAPEMDGGGPAGFRRRVEVFVQR